MPDENRELIRKAISWGSNLVGSGVGGALQFYALSPGDSAFASVAGTLIGQMLEVGAEVCCRTLSSRESKRVGAACAFGALEIQKRLDRGEKPRNDGFFTPDETNRSAADELFEGVLLKCKNAHEEKKLKFLSNIFANATFMDVAAADANSVLSIAERLTYRQICVLAAFDGHGEFVTLLRVNNVDGLIDKLWYGGAQILAHDVQEVFEAHGLIGLSDHIGPNSPPEKIHVGLTSLGQIAFTLMGLGDIGPADVADVVARFKAALGQM